MNILSILQLGVSLAPTIKAILDEASSNDTIIQKVTALSPTLAGVLTGVGAQLFPKAAPALHVVGGAIAAFDPNVTKWVQGEINALGYTPALTVDGSYGPKTAAGVEWLQAKLGLKVDGLAGQVTQAALQALLAKPTVLK